MKKPLLLLSFFAAFPLFFSCSKSDEPVSACEATVSQFTDEANGFFDYFAAVRAENGAIIVSGNQATLEVEGDFIQVLGYTFNLCQMKWYQLDNIGPGRNLVIYF